MAAALVRSGSFVALLTLAATARADVTHVVQRGHTIEAIARRYRVSVKALVEANHLKDTNHLKPGQTLIIPGAEAKKKGPPDSSHRAAHPAAMHATTAVVAARPEPRGHESREGLDLGHFNVEASTIHAVRLGEDFRVRVKDTHGHISVAALKAFERLMRQGNATHSIDPRLVALVGIVSNHFGGKPIDVVSGYRPYTPAQYTRRSNHNYGKAIDFRIAGVNNEAIRDFCRTLRSAGCGYYPNDTFVHMDVRDTKAYWVDWSEPGQPPKYDKPEGAADEGHSDVPAEATPLAAEKPDEAARKGAPTPSDEETPPDSDAGSAKP